MVASILPRSVCRMMRMSCMEERKPAARNRARQLCFQGGDGPAPKAPGNAIGYIAPSKSRRGAARDLGLAAWGGLFPLLLSGFRLHCCAMPKKRSKLILATI